MPFQPKTKHPVLTRPISSPQKQFSAPKFWSPGIKPVADYVHSKDMLFGIYTARGSSTCMGRPGSDSHETIDAETFAAWGVVSANYTS